MSDFARVEAPADVTGPDAPAPNMESGQGPAGIRPEWLPPKFNSPEDLAKAYVELETKLGKPQQEATEDKPKEGPEPGKTEGDFYENQGLAVQQLADKGLEFSKFQQEYDANGGLSQESYSELQASGFSKDFVDSWIAGQEALSQNVVASVFTALGGEENFKKMVEWAQTNLPPSQIEAFNHQIDTTDANTLTFAVKGLYAQYQNASGSEPTLVRGAPASPVSGFRSQGEMIEAMQDPRYRTDSAYRADVERKVAASTFF